MEKTLTKYATVSWNVNDVLDTMDEMGLELKWTEAEAEAFLVEHERCIEERLSILGNEILEDLLRQEE